MGIASEIVMIDINEKKALGEAHGHPPGHSVLHAMLRSMRAAMQTQRIPTSSSSRPALPVSPASTRLDLAQTNVNIIKSITAEASRRTRRTPSICIVSNPVDILTYTFCKCSGIPESRILGSGTHPRHRPSACASLAEYYQINQQNVHAYVLGEHGDSSFVPWSVANISNIPANAYQKAMENTDGMLIPPLNYADVEDYMRKSGGNVIKRKGATFYAVSISVCHIVKCILSGIDTNMTVSTMLNGEYGISDVCLSLLTTVGHKGVVNKLNLPLTESEHAALVHSSECLKEIIKKVQI